MIAIVIIVASNGNSDPAWLATISAAPVGGHVRDALGLRPATRRRRGTRTAGRPPRRTPRRSPTRPRGTRPRSRRTSSSTASRSRPGSADGRRCGRGQRVEPVLDPAAQPRAGSRRPPPARASVPAPALIASRPIRASRRRERPGCRLGADPPARALARRGRGPRRRRRSAGSKPTSSRSRVLSTPRP